MSIMACLLLLAVANAAAAEDYHARGELYAYAHNADNGVPIMREIPAGAAWWVSDAATQVGPSGNVATARYFADLSTGRLGTFISGYGEHANEYGGGGASLEAMASMDDRIDVTIPEGIYDQDLYVELRGYVRGTISASGIDASRESNGYQAWTFALGGPLGGDGQFSVRTPDVRPGTSPYVVDEDFLLTARILYAGRLENERTVSLTVNASMKSKGAALATYPYGDAVTSVLCDFGSTGAFTSLAAPEGCTWVSASGVFIPEPASGVLLLAALACMTRPCRRLNHNSST